MGEFSNIVETPYGYHILTVDKIYPRGFQPFNDVKAEIRKYLIRQNEAAAFSKMALELEKSADSKIFADRF